MPDRSVKVRLISQVDSYVAGMKQAQRVTSEFGREISGQGKATHAQMEQVGRGALLMSAGMIAGFGLAAKAAIDWESAWAGVTKTVDGTEAELSSLEDGLRDMAKTLPATHAEIAGVAEAAGQLGIGVNDVEAFTRVMIDLGETTNMSANDAATALARLANITQMPADEFDNLGSTVVELGNNLATTEGEIVEMGLRLAGAGNQIGLSEAQILGFAGALSSVGIEAEAGGSAISKVMIDIASEVENGGDKLETFAAVAGMSAAEFSTAYRDDAAGALVTFIEGLGNMEAQGGSTLGVLEELGITEVRMRDALLRASGAGDLFRQSLELGSAAWEENNALQTEAEQRYNTTAAQMEMFRNEVVDLAIDVGGMLLPVLTGLIDVAGGMLDAFSDLPGPLTEIAAILGGLSAAGLGVIGVIGVMAPKVAAMQTALNGMGDAGKALSRNMGRMAGGMVGVAAAVGAGVFIYDRATRSGREYATTVNDLTAAFSAVTDGQQDFNAALEEFLSLEFDKIGTEGVRGLNNLGITMSDVQEDIYAGRDALDSVRDAVNDLGIELDGYDVGKLDDIAMVEPLQNMADAMGISRKEVKELIERLEDLDNQTQDAAEAQLVLAVSSEKVTQAEVDAAVSAGTFASALDELFPKTEEATGASGEYSEAQQGAATAAEDAAEAQRALFAAMDTTIDLMLGGLTALAEWEAGLDKISESAKENGTSLDLTTEAGRNNHAMVTDLVNAGRDRIQQLIEEGATSDEVAGSHALMTMQLEEQLRQLGFNEAEIAVYIEALGSVPTEVPTEVAADTETALNVLDGASSGYFAAGSRLGSQIGQGVVAGLNSQRAAAAAAAANYVASLESRARQAAEIQSPSRLFARTVGKPIAEGVAAGIAEFAHLSGDELEDAIQEAEKRATDAARSLVSSVEGAISDLWDAIDAPREREGLEDRVADAEEALRSVISNRARLGSEIRQAQSDLAAARESGDLDAIKEAAKDLEELQKDRIDTFAEEEDAVEKLEEANYRLLRASEHLIDQGPAGVQTFTDLALAAGVELAEVEKLIGAHQRLGSARAGVGQTAGGMAEWHDEMRGLGLTDLDFNHLSSVAGDRAKWLADLETILERRGAARATGGPVQAGQAYLVNEHTARSEIFVPGSDGSVLTPAQWSGRGGSTTSVDLGPLLAEAKATRSEMEATRGAIGELRAEVRRQTDRNLMMTRTA